MTFTPASDRALLVTVGEGVSIETNAQVHLLSRLLQTMDGITSQSPAYASLLVRFDPLKLTHEALQALIVQTPLDVESAAEPRVVEIPIQYNGPDLAEVAERCSLTPAQVVEAHTSVLYHAYFAGFVPGFVYLGEVPQAIAVPRRATPRRQVSAGSVGIAGTQTGIYPVETPGGWNLIGYTAAVMFDRQRACALVEPGDQVRFVRL